MTANRNVKKKNAILNRESLIEVSHNNDDGDIVRGEEVDGVSNLAFENNEENRGAGVGAKKKSKPIIHFPLPPTSRPSSTTSRYCH